MTYQMPELLLVGAAHSLVLGGIDVKLPGLNEDSPGLGLYDWNNVDSNGW